MLVELCSQDCLPPPEKNTKGRWMAGRWSTVEVCVKALDKSFEVRLNLPHGLRVTEINERVTAKLSHPNAGPKELSQADIRVKDMVLMNWDKTITFQHDDVPLDTNFKANLTTPIAELFELFPDSSEHLPVVVDVDLSNYPNLLNQWVTMSPEDSARLWNPSRLEINQDRNRVLITKSVQNVLKMVDDRFVKKSVIWDSKVICGLSGSGKSVAFALAAAYLKQKGLEVYWFRQANWFTGDINSKVLRKKGKNRFVVLFVDQIDKHESISMLGILRTGNQVNELAVVGCGSGNISLPKSSSESVIISDTFHFDPSISFQSFRTIFDFGGGESVPPVVFKSTREMLTFKPMTFQDLWEGTSGHFSSLMAIKCLIDNDIGIYESWLKVKETFAPFAHSFLKKEENPTFALLLHRCLFTPLNQSPPDFEREFEECTDHRYIWERKIHSSLFVQMYHQILLMYHLSSKQLLRSKSIIIPHYDNQVMVGFAIERMAIRNFQGLKAAALNCVELCNLFELTDSDEIDPTSQYGYDAEIEIDPMILPTDQPKIKFFHFIPILWNEEFIDLIQVLIFKKIAFVIGNQITLQTAEQHKSSLNWLTKQNNLCDQLSLRGFEVTKVLLFTCSQRPSKQLKADAKTVALLKDLFILDFPLENAIPKDLWSEFQIWTSDVHKVQDSARILKLVASSKKRTKDPKGGEQGEKDVQVKTSKRSKKALVKSTSPLASSGPCCTCTTGTCKSCLCRRTVCNSSCSSHRCKDKARNKELSKQ
jgi:hypothetical protein